MAATVRWTIVLYSSRFLKTRKMNCILTALFYYSFYTHTFTHMYAHSWANSYSYSGTHHSAKFLADHRPPCNLAIKRGSLEFIGLLPWFRWTKAGGGWGDVDRKREEDGQSHTAFYAGAQINNATTATTMRIFMHIFLWSVQFFRTRETERGNTIFQTVTAPLLTLQTRFRLAGGFCKRTEVQRHELTPRKVLTG